MGESITLSDLCATRERLMQQWELALETAVRTGFWEDVEACAAVMDAFHEEVKKLLEAGRCSGDGIKALSLWEEIKVSELNYRQLLDAEARRLAPKPTSDEWWAILGVGPDASDEAVKAAYLQRLRKHDSDRHAASPMVAEIANVSIARLYVAYAESKKRMPVE